jgi:hypothetical protein
LIRGLAAAGIGNFPPTIVSICPGGHVPLRLETKQFDCDFWL